MKQQILNLKKKLLLIEIGGELSTEFLAIMNEHGMAEILGKLTDITEEQFAEWVEKFYDGAIRDYREGSFDPADDLANFCLTAQESFFSYLELQGIYFGNPYGEEPFVPFYAPYGMTIEEYNLELRAAEYKKGEWQEAEEKVWSKDNCYIFEII